MTGTQVLFDDGLKITRVMVVGGGQGRGDERNTVVSSAVLCPTVPCATSGLIVVLKRHVLASDGGSELL